MSFNIEEFKAKGLSLGGARPSQFLVTLSPPTILNEQSNAESFQFVCRAAQIPAAIVSPVEVAYFGRRVKYSGDREFPDWTVTVMNDADFRIRRMMERWSEAMNVHIDNTMVSNIWPTGYKQTAEVTQFNQAGDSVATYQMVGLFPTQIDAIPLDWEAMNQIETFDITFSYDYWVLKQGDDRSYSSTDGTAAGLIPGVNNS